VTLVVWNEPCALALFNVAPTNVSANTPVTITWRADHCKNVKVLERLFEVPPPPRLPRSANHVIEEATFVNQPAGTVEGTRSLTVSPLTTAVGLRASSATGKTWMDFKEIQVNPAGPCPQNQPYGQKKWFDVCEKCLGRPPNQTSVRACTKEAAREEEDRFLLGTNCAADDGACFADGSGGGGPVPSRPDAGPDTAAGCCCRPGGTQPICNCCEVEWACRNSAGATWTQGDSCP
jgi:hypothetical protein